MLPNRHFVKGRTKSVVWESKCERAMEHGDCLRGLGLDDWMGRDGRRGMVRDGSDVHVA